MPKKKGKTDPPSPSESSKDKSDIGTSNNEGERTKILQQEGSEKKNERPTSEAAIDDFRNDASDSSRKGTGNTRQRKDNQKKKSTPMRKVKNQTQSGSGKTRTKKWSAKVRFMFYMVWGLLLAVAVLLVVALCVPFLDWSPFFNMVNSFSDIPSLDFSYFRDFLKGSTNSGFCDPYKSDTCDDFLRKKFQDLALKYRNQSSNTWFTVYAAARDHVSHQPDPKRPVVIMVYRLKNSSRVNEILEDIATVYNSVLSPNRNYGNVLIDGEIFTDTDPEETQKEVQGMFEDGFETKAQKVAIVRDFDKLPSCSVLVFHNYCNNEDAPHKNVAIILTVTAQEGEISSEPSAPELEKAVGELFHEKWKDCPKELPPGKIDAMLSRVSNNVILLR